MIDIQLKSNFEFQIFILSWVSDVRYNALVILGSKPELSQLHDHNG